jgi:CheY-like chemotaxis protein
VKRPRIVLVEDDAALRRFVEMVLEDLPLDVIACEDVQEAVTALRAAPADLILTDLMMPGETGIDLLNQLKAEPNLTASAQIIVMSAGLTTAMRTELARHSILQVIEKPVSVVLLEQSIVAALGDKLAHQGSIDAAVSNPEPTLPPVSSRTEPRVKPEVEPHIAAYFGGDLDLFTAYRDACLAEIPNDIRQADTSAGNADWAALRLVAHNLSSVLTALGKRHLSSLAKALELASQAGDAAVARANWSALRTPLQAMTHGAG